MSATRIFTIFIETDEKYWEFVEVEAKTAEALESVKEEFKEHKIDKLEVYSDFSIDDNPI